MSKLYCFSTQAPCDLPDLEVLDGFICYRVMTFTAGRRRLLAQRFKSYSSLVSWLRKNKPFCAVFYYEMEDSHSEYRL